MNMLSIIKSEKGIAFPTIIFVVTLVALMTVTISFMTQSQLANTEVMSDSTMAFNIAESGLERLLSVYGANYPNNITNSDVVVYNSVALNGGTYTTKVKKDPSRAGNILITSTGTNKSLSRTIQVSVKGVPAAFNYGIISNGALGFEGHVKGNGYMLINGNVHSEGDMNLEGSHIFINTPTYDGATGNNITNPEYDPQWKTTLTGSISPNNPAFTGPVQQVAAGSVTLPETNYAYYSNQANFTKQQVFLYSGSKKDWTVAEFNNYFEPTGAYTSSIVIMQNGEISLSGSGTITATILTGTNQDNKGDIFILSDPTGVINFLPAIGLAMVAEKYEIGGTVNIGSKDVGAIVIATEELEIEGQWNTPHKRRNVPSMVTIWGSIVLGETDDNNAQIELDGDDNAQNVLHINFTSSAVKNLPAGWENWGTTSMVKDNWKES